MTYNGTRLLRYFTKEKMQLQAQTQADAKSKMKRTLKTTKQHTFF
jgi:hypothetical protein